MTATPPTHVLTMADLHRSLGEVPLERICMNPLPGTATEDDLLRLSAQNNTLYELVDGTLVEKATGALASWITTRLLIDLSNFVDGRNLGFVLSPDAPYQVSSTKIRLPDLSFVPWSRVPETGFPSKTVETTIPTLAIEVLSPSNRPGEMKLKREVYFKAGVDLVWMVDPDSETVEVYTSDTDFTTLTHSDTLDGGTVLPGFTLPVARIFTLPQRPTIST